MDNLKRQFLLDHLSGMSTTDLAAKWGISLQAVAARLRWAEERGDTTQVREEMAISPSESDENQFSDSSPEGSPRASPHDEVKPAAYHEKNAKTPEEIRALFGSLHDSQNLRRLHRSARIKIATYEARIGRKDAGFRIAQEQWIRQERCRLLGLTLNDLRRMRGIRV